jgi:putative flippase GtrA
MPNIASEPTSATTPATVPIDANYSNLKVKTHDYPDRDAKKEKDTKMILKTRKYYGRERKGSIDEKANEFPNSCALENHKIFLLKINVQNAAMKKLFFVSCICFIFMGCEFAGGIISGSLAILADAAHMFSDVAGFMISFFSIYISQRKQTFDHGYGYHRSEVLGALCSIFLIWGLLVWLNYEAVQRIITPPEDIEADIMLITAIIGFLCNVTNFVALNWACKAPEDDEEDDETDAENSALRQSSINDNWTIDNKSQIILKGKKRNVLSLSQSLMGIYQPR